MWKDITEHEKDEFNTLATHPLQSFEWGEFREKTGVKVIRKGLFDGKKLVQSFQLTIHKIPHTSWTIGYLPKGIPPTKELINELKNIGKENNCIFIQLEPNIIKNNAVSNKNYAKDDLKSFESILHNSKFMILPSAHPLFTKYTFQLDLTKSEEELLKHMHPKTRYNIRVAEKHNVTVREESTEETFTDYWKLTQETTQRQGFYAHTPSYHKKMWETLRENDKGSKIKDKKIDHSSFIFNHFNQLSAHLLIARYNKQALTTWILFVFHDTLYYPYGASSSQHRETMSSNLQMWEAIKFGKKLGLKNFDMWGSLGETPDTKDPWYGFHKFKQGYGPTLVEFIGSFDLVINPLLYQGYKLADTLRWIFLKLKK